MSTTPGRIAAIVIGAIVLLLVVLAVLGGAWTPMGPGMMGYYGVRPWGGVLMMFLMLLFWALVIGGVIWLVLWLLQGGRPPVGAPSSHSRALEILRERYARGEITREQYEQMRRDLTEEGGPGPGGR